MEFGAAPGGSWLAAPGYPYRLELVGAPLSLGSLCFSPELSDFANRGDHSDQHLRSLKSILKTSLLRGSRNDAANTPFWTFAARALARHSAIFKTPIPLKIATLALQSTADLPMHRVSLQLFCL